LIASTNRAKESQLTICGLVQDNLIISIKSQFLEIAGGHLTTRTHQYRLLVLSQKVALYKKSTIKQV